MTENQAHAGNGPAPLPALTDAEDFTGKHLMPATTRLHNALASCEALIGKCVERADNTDYYVDTRLRFVLAAGRLAAAQAVTAGAIARLADAESRQRLANVKVDDSILRPRRTPNSGSSGDVTTTDWEKQDSESKKSTFNSAFAGPRIRNV